jgi:hypothetical protein
MISNVCLIVLMSRVAADSGADAERDAGISLARQTLQQQIKIDEVAIEVEDATAVDWPDASLGCPQKGMAFIQVITPGFRVRLRAGDKSYEIHVGGGRARMCPELSGPGGDSYVASAARLAAEARRDLAQRLKVSEQKIEVAFARPTTWPDADLGCHRAGAKVAPVETKGFLIELAHEGRTYRYHTDMSHVRFCE